MLCPRHPVVYALETCQRSIRLHRKSPKVFARNSKVQAERPITFEAPDIRPSSTRNCQSLHSLRNRTHGPQRSGGLAQTPQATSASTKLMSDDDRIQRSWQRVLEGMKQTCQSLEVARSLRAIHGLEPVRQYSLLEFLIATSASNKLMSDDNRTQRFWHNIGR
jgi:hypothetical protein